MTVQNITTPLADRMRPEKIDDFLGQEEIIGKEKLLRNAIETDNLPSIIFWGPPGSGKTTLAFIIAKQTKSEFIRFSAVTSGVAELRKTIKKAGINKQLGKRTILFIDEIHRWNKAQQDALLPHVERGTIILIGATTENPSFEVRGALLSRCSVFVLKQLEEIREKKFYISHGERDPYVAAFSVPLFDIMKNNIIGSLSISGPLDRFKKRFKNKHIEFVKSKALQIQTLMNLESNNYV